MYKKLKNLSALIMASFTTELHAEAIPVDAGAQNAIDDTFASGLLNLTIPDQLAAHRSHSSHSSHRSHRSSSGGGYSAPSYPSGGSTGTDNEPKKTTPQKQADPLGQQAKPKSSYPPENKKTLTEKLKDKETRKNVIMQMQLRLQFEKYYSGAIDGVMNQDTRNAVMAYKKAKGITGDAIFDVQTLNAMGILVN